MPFTLMMLSYNNVKNIYQSIVATGFDVDPDTVNKSPIVHQGCALYLYIVPILYCDIQYLMRCYNTNTTICDSDSNPDCNFVHYGVMYVYVYSYAYYIVQLLLYNIQRSIGCDNINTTICDNNNLCHAAGLLYLPIVMKKKIVSTSTINVDDNNFGFDSYHDFDLNKQRPTY